MEANQNKLASLICSLMFAFNLYAAENQIDYYYKYLTLTGNHILGVNSLISKTELSLKENLKLQEEDKGVDLNNFECSQDVIVKGANSNELTILEQMIQRDCNYLLKLSASNLEAQKSYEITQNTIGKFIYNSKESSLKNDVQADTYDKQKFKKERPRKVKLFPALTNITMVSGYAPELLKKQEELYGKNQEKEASEASSEDLAQNKEDTTQDQKESSPSKEDLAQKEVPVKSSCGKYDRICEGLPVFPSSDYTFSSLYCADLGEAKAGGRYDYTCKGDKIVLLSRPYRWVKRVKCKVEDFEIAHDIIKSSGDVFLLQNKSTKDYKYVGCLGGLGGIRVEIATLQFLPTPCAVAGKRPGDIWWQAQDTKEVQCSWMCDQGPKKAKRYVEYLWECKGSGKGYIFPGYDNRMGISMSKIFKIENRRRGIHTRLGKWSGKACQSTQIQNPAAFKNVCGDDKESFPTCSGKYPVELKLSQLQKIMENDGMYSPQLIADAKIQYCSNSYTVRSSGHQCGEKGQKYKKCFNRCRTQCRDQEVGPSLATKTLKMPFVDPDGAEYYSLIEEK